MTHNRGRHAGRTQAGEQKGRPAAANGGQCPPFGNRAISYVIARRARRRGDRMRRRAFIILLSGAAAPMR
jgi:hypothetical protein